MMIHIIGVGIVLGAVLVAALVVYMILSIQEMS